MSAYLGAQATKVLPKVPMTWMLADEASLTGGRVTGHASVTYGARKQYIEAYKEWHRSLRNKPLAAYRVGGGKRPFLAPHILLQRDGKVELDTLYVFDFSHDSAGDICRVIEARHASLSGVGLAHWPVLKPEMTNAQSAHVRRLVARTGARVCVPGDTVEAHTVFFSSPELLAVRPDAFAEVAAERFGYL